MDIDQTTLNQIFGQIGVATQAISQLNHDYTALVAQHASMSANVEWLMKFFWIIAASSIGSFMTSVWYLITHYRKKNGDNK